MKEIILDIGGESNYFKRKSLSSLPDHPLWGRCIWFTLNIDHHKEPDIVGDAINLSNIRSASVHGIYSSHTIEHLPPDVSLQMFTEWFRILRPGGRVEIRCPDIEWAWKEYFAGRLPEELLTELMLGIRVGPHENHRNMWWASKLTSELSACGFDGVSRIDYGFNRPYIDHWPYDGRYEEYHGFKVIDLLIEAYKAPIDAESPVLASSVRNDLVHEKRNPAGRSIRIFRRYVNAFLRPIMEKREAQKVRALLDDILVD